jgi:hypothetical protein
MTNGTRKTLMSNADANTQYVVTLKATDLLRFTTMDFILPSADCPFHIPSGKHGMGIGMKAQASDNTLYVGYDAKFYGALIKHDTVKNIDVNIPKAYEPLIAYGTEIPSNANLNTTTYVDVGTYYQADSSKVTTFTNCPTTNAFTMIVRNVTKTDADTSAKSWQYIVREITDISGNKYIQRAYCVSVGSWTFGAWHKIVTNERKTGTITMKNSATLLSGENYAYEQGGAVYIHLSISSLPTLTADTQTQVASISGITLPPCSIRTEAKVGTQLYLLYDNIYCSAYIENSALRIDVCSPSSKLSMKKAVIDIVYPIAQ